jgi:RNA polymerase sigma factor (sigma-70 family)
MRSNAEQLAIAERIGAGDRAAFTAFMQAHNRRLFRVARAVLGNDADAEDALQDAYLAAYRSIHQFRGDSALSTWLTRLLLNECLARKRRTHRRQNVVPLVDSSPQSDIEVSNVAAGDSLLPENAVARGQMREILQRKVDELPEAYRLTFVLRSVEELSIEEVSALLGVSEATVRSRHFRAKSLLRESLARDVDLAEREIFEFGGDHCSRIVARVLERLDESVAQPQD